MSVIKSETLKAADLPWTAMEDNIIGKGRWVIHREIIFKWEDGKVYRARYNQGATENQEQEPWEHQDEVKCTEVELVREIGYRWAKIGETCVMVEGDLYG